MHILLTGGAGYIGSHTAKHILETTEHELTVLDNLSTGNINTIHTLQNIRPFAFIKQDLGNFYEIHQYIEQNKFDTIIHFAASIVVPESVRNPTKYYLNNTANTTNLIQAATKHQVKKFIFSSTAAVYGEPNSIPDKGISEEFSTQPINPYGSSKLMSEQVLADSAEAHGMKFVIFRYFNVAGADIYYENEELRPRIGQSFPKATHLIKVACENATGKRDKVAIFGTDFSTTDGTGVRDYIHVDDLAYAHILAVDYLDDNESDIFNVGYGQGYSVREVLDTIHNSFAPLQIEEEGRRLGDPAALIANSDKIKNKMLWKPKYDNLELICQSAFTWEMQT